MNWLFPNHCLVCHRLCDDYTCQGCFDALPWLGHSCYQCAAPLSNTLATHCGQCQSQPPYFQRTRAVFHYQDPIKSALIQLKFHQQLQFAKVFGSYLTEHIKTIPKLYWPDYLIPVPLHQKRLKKRGFNQALEISKYVSKSLNIPIWPHLIRTKNTPPQSSLAANQRGQNIKTAFKYTIPLPASRIAIIDDIMTTGSTANEMAKTLNQHTCYIEHWCISRA